MGTSEKKTQRERKSSGQGKGGTLGGRNICAALLFVDVETAYYSTLRELVLDTGHSPLGRRALPHVGNALIIQIGLDGAGVAVDAGGLARSSELRGVDLCCFPRRASRKSRRGSASSESDKNRFRTAIGLLPQQYRLVEVPAALDESSDL